MNTVARIRQIMNKEKSMKYRLRRDRKLAFQNFSDSLLRAEKQLPELESETVPHHSDWYAAKDFQDLADQIEFRAEGEGDDEVLDEAGNVVGHIEEEMATPILVDLNKKAWFGPQLRGEGDVSDLSNEEYAKRTVQGLFKKSN